MACDLNAEASGRAERAEHVEDHRDGAEAGDGARLAGSGTSLHAPAAPGHGRGEGRPLTSRTERRERDAPGASHVDDDTQDDDTDDLRARRAGGGLPARTAHSGDGGHPASPAVTETAFHTENRLMRAKVCAVCGTSLPKAKSAGRPRLYCSLVCGERARQRRRRAAKLLEFAQRQDELADGTARGEVRRFGNERYLRGYAARLRELAVEELRGLPL